MKQRLALVSVLAIVIAATGCAWTMPDAAPLVIYRRQGTGSRGSIFISMWQLTVDVNGKLTVVGNPGSPLQTVPKLDVASSESLVT